MVELAPLISKSKCYGVNLADLIKCAHEAMNAAKEGKLGYVFA